jgi:cytochrome c oxidase subunit II
MPDRPPSIVDPRGPAAQAIADLWWLVAVLGLAVFAVVVVLVLISATRRRDGSLADDTLAGERWAGGGNALIVVGGVAVPTVVILVLQVLSMTTAADVRVGDRNPAEPLRIEVTGHKFWWDVAYPDLDIRTANELHVPVGRPVEVAVTSADVIHSFWVPQVAGKIDMNPGHTNHLELQADEPGVYRGLCTEYCGIQHARMQLVLVALEPADFDTWTADRAGPPAEPEGAARLGREVFEAQQCIHCHAVEGVSGMAQLGPDLTHLGSRLTLGAGILPNDRDTLRDWVVDPQRFKPGSRMPPTNVDGDELEALLDYLLGLE